ncbi:hypothetical protein DdX_14981 [Ditylenchus destructor]|uniref:Uncharacterized protein n=1 Tax=Ditylenchus destructor TaxID=166010 RepID=A0AAD4QV70_9BILA|nr:hypothetical protein DdX_14981 [Ditylenchus destructor]
MEFLPPTPAKRKRLALSDAAKNAICVYKRDHPSAKPEDVATEIQQRFQLDEAPARRTIYDILKESNKNWHMPQRANSISNLRQNIIITPMNAIEFIDFDEALPTGEQLTDESIIAIVTGSTESEESEEDEQEGLETVMEPTQIKDAIACGKTFLSYLEQNQLASVEEILTVMNLTDRLVDEEIKKRRQSKITEFLRQEETKEQKSRNSQVSPGWLPGFEEEYGEER